ncbi:MAG: hypothetical protein QME21_18635 [Anaerolineales bacterium]|nr:hypothetical protein [Anaerolineales bacterium]
MTRRPQSRGRCMFCHSELSKAGTTRHLDACPQRQQAIQAAEASDRPSETLWRLRVQDAYLKDFWLDLEMRGSATLTKLDEYLRAIWLECCGHLSEFTIGGWGGVKVAKARKADQVFEPELVLRHLYDFGTTSETDIRVVGSRRGKALNKHPIALLARNIQPEVICQECDQPAEWLCMECIYEENKPGFLCTEHVEMHPHEDYGGPLELVNSPRLGMCGYIGPAEPPY